jgi:hypothetical protein
MYGKQKDGKTRWKVRRCEIVEEEEIKFGKVMKRVKLLFKNWPNIFGEKNRSDFFFFLGDFFCYQKLER